MSLLSYTLFTTLFPDKFAAFASGFGFEPDICDYGGAVDGFHHIVYRKSGNAGGRKRFHFHPRFACDGDG